MVFEGEQMSAISKEIRFFGHPCIVACDAKCSKAWGGSHRPKAYRMPSGEYVPMSKKRAALAGLDEDDYAYLADGELGEAPLDPGTEEGGNPKPYYPQDRLNKWCARECERSVIVDIGEPIILPDFSQRYYNRSPHDHAPAEPAPKQEADPDVYVARFTKPPDGKPITVYLKDVEIKPYSDPTPPSQADS